jgi:DNA-binding MarR family transcriptional regulator
LNLDAYAPAYFTWIANKLASGASKAYRGVFGVGIETWRVLVLLAIERSITAQSICRVIGLDKASVSRTLKSMQSADLVRIALDPLDGRYRVATITSKGRDLHDRIMQVALERERALLSVLSDDETAILLGLLKRLHENLPQVEERTAAFVAKHYPPRKARRRTQPTPGAD